MKAILKGAECCFQLSLFDDSIKWCDKALSLNSNDTKAKDLRIKCEVSKKTFEKEKRKKEAALRKRVEKHSKILNYIKTRGIQIEEKDQKFIDLIENPINYSMKSVCLSEDQSSLLWPVILLYPECKLIFSFFFLSIKKKKCSYDWLHILDGQTDFIEAFDENSTLEDHLKVVLSEQPAWDKNKSYNIDSIQVIIQI